MKPLFYELIKKRDVLILKVLLEDVLKRAKSHGRFGSFS